MGFRSIRMMAAFAVVGFSSTVLAASGAKELFWGPDGPMVLESPTAKKPGNIEVAVKPDSKPSDTTIASGQNPYKTRRSAETQGLQVWVNLVDASGQTRRVSPASHVFRSGDKIELEFKTNTSGYLYVVNVGTSGVVRPMFPRSQGQDNYVEAWSQAKISSKIVFDHTPGTEQLAIVLSKSPRKDVGLHSADGRLITVALDRETQLASIGNNVPPSAAAAPSSGGTKPAGTATPQPSGGNVTVANKRGADDNVTLALADLQGAKDLKFEDDGEMVTVVMKTEGKPQPGLSSGKGRVPLVVNLKLKHE